MRDLSSLAKDTVLDTVDSKSKSKPSTTASPKGLLMLVFDVTGPKMAQTFCAAAIAAAEEVKPASV